MRTKRIENAKETMKKVKSSGIRNTQKITATGINADGDGTATRKMIDNLGQVGAGVARVTGRTALGTAQSVAAAPGALKMAAKQRKDDVESGVSRRLGSRLRLRKDDPETKERRRQKRIERIGKLRTLAIKKAGEQKSAKQEKEKQDRGVVQQKALPAAKKRLALPSSTTGSALRAPTNPMTQRQKNDARIAAFKKKREEQRAAGIPMRSNATEEFIYEVEDMKKDKVDKVIDIMRGKNKIEVNPKISESHLLVQDLADYKPLEFETVDIIKPEPLKASNWRNEISEEDKKIISINKGKRLDAKKQAFKDMVDEPYETDDKKRKEYGKKLLDRLTKVDEGAAWTKKEGKNKSGGLNEKGRKSYERENPGSDLKAPSKKVGNPRRKSFCARMKGMKKKLTSKKTASDPNSRINKSLRAWNC